MSSGKTDYVKICTKTLLGKDGVEHIPLKFVLALATQMQNFGDGKIYFFNNKTTRQAISAYCNITDNMISKHIKRSVDVGILCVTDNRGIYKVNQKLLTIS